MQNTIRHLAIIMDGNGRWAKLKGKPRVKGHEAGAESVRRVLKEARRQEIDHLTLYAFSSENWQRPETEVKALMKLLERFLKSEADELDRNDVRLHIIGDLSRLSAKLQKSIQQTCARLDHNRGIQLNLALNYGGRDEIVRAARKLSQYKPEEITEELLSAQLDTAGIPDPDLLIRTGGEIRISNFLPWQLVYSEFYFTDTLWPDFDEAELHKAIEWFMGRQRRFGLTGDQIGEKQ